jgi:HTH-type transcriptional regulator / antitoxin HigA
MTSEDTVPSLTTFAPDYASPPGATLREILETKGISQTDLAARTELTEKTISQIINGTASLSYETAEKLELVLGVPARFWNAREAHYREALLRIEESKRHEAEMDWLAQIPFKELIKRGYIAATEGAALVRETLKFFQVSSIAAWQKVWGDPVAQFRGAKAKTAHPGYVAAWIRMGEIDAEKIECAPYDEQKFKLALEALRSQMCNEPSVWFPQMRALCAAAGVAVVLVKEIAGASVSGATKWIGKDKSDKALLLLSLKYKTDDQFWFTFFHEACHILRHKKKAIFYEFGHGTDSPEEVEANKFAADFLIPTRLVVRLPALRTKNSIKLFAAEIGVPPGIVVGRLQRETILPQSHCNDLKAKFVWENDASETKQD